MSEVKMHPPGAFSWFELGTTDDAGAKTFYADLFGWQPNDVAMDEQFSYTLLRIEDQDVAGLYGLMPEQRAQQVPPHWLSYVAVASVDEAVARAEALGGSVVTGPHDVFELGRMAVLQDPTGGVFALWEARQHIGAGRVNEAGTFCWAELGTHDPDAAEAFYTGLFGWGTSKQPMGEMGTYTSFLNGGQHTGGLFRLPPEAGATPPQWYVYFAVDDCDATVDSARALGATVAIPPSDVPGVGRFACMQDPQGAFFSVIRMNGPADGQG